MTGLPQQPRSVQIHITTGTYINVAYKVWTKYLKGCVFQPNSLNTIILGFKNAASLLLDLVFKPECSDCMFWTRFKRGTTNKLYQPKKVEIHSNEVWERLIIF